MESFTARSLTSRFYIPCSSVLRFPLFYIRSFMQPQSQATKAHLAVLATNIFFATNFSFVKLISPSLVGPFALNVLRVGISLMLFWCVWLMGKTPVAIQRKDWPRFILCGLTGITLNQLLFVKGLTLTSVVHASLLTLVTPIIVTVFAFVVLKEGFSLFKALGLALGIGGAMFLILQKEGSGNAPDYLLGDTLIIFNAISYSVYFIAVKPLMASYSPLHVIRWVFTIGFFFILPVGWSQLMDVQWSAFGLEHYGALLSISVLGTFLAYYFNIYGIQHLGASITGTYIYTQPVFAVAVAILFLGEGFSWQKGLAAVMIFAGVFLVNLKRR